jgi:hypothetical protein
MDFLVVVFKGGGRPNSKYETTVCYTRCMFKYDEMLILASLIILAGVLGMQKQ